LVARGGSALNPVFVGLDILHPFTDFAAIFIAAYRQGSLGRLIEQLNECRLPEPVERRTMGHGQPDSRSWDMNKA
jgi:hypothetical protein